MDQHQNEIVTRSAPRWVWELIDDTLAPKALEAMVKACEGDFQATPEVLDNCEKPLPEACF
jgi:hypothetical protein